MKNRWMSFARPCPLQGGASRQRERCQTPTQADDKCASFRCCRRRASPSMTSTVASCESGTGLHLFPPEPSRRPCCEQGQRHGLIRSLTTEGEQAERRPSPREGEGLFR